ncbi:MAG TPA: hypothetical protein PKB14_21710 [Rubrivivax sp.]|nr:hypothetical protein [Rubrivivax sp.]
MGYIASRSQASTIVVVANDKGYQPMIEHARAMGFKVRQQGHRRSRPDASAKAAAAKPAAETVTAKQPAVKRAKKAAAKKTNTNTSTPTAKKAAANSTGTTAATSLAAAEPAHAAPAPAPVPSLAPAATPSLSPVSADLLQKLTVNLRKMNGKRPAKAASLRRALKSFLGVETGDESIEVALGKLITRGVVALGAKGDVSYPGISAASACTGT